MHGEGLNSRRFAAPVRRTALGVALAALLAVLGNVPGTASATPLFLTPINISDAGQDAFEPSVVEDASGNMMFVWTRSDGTNLRIQARFRAADGTWDTAQTISDPGGDASEPQVAFDPSGNAVAVWNRFDGSKTRVQAAFRPSGGSFEAPQTISGGGQNASNPRVSMDNSGDAVAVWERLDGANLRIEAAVRPASGSFGATQILSTSGQDAFEPKVAAGPNVDDNAVAVWTRFDGSNLRVQSARRHDVVGFPRPKGGSPVRASLVPAYQECTSSNRSHGAPLSYPSCAPPVASSSVLTVGTPDAPANGAAANSIDSLIYTVLSGDVGVELSMTDIRNKPSMTDYTGRVLARVPLQITDRNNSAELPETGTVQTIPLQFPADCVATGSTTIGSTCKLTTTVNAQVPGAVLAGQRSIWEFGQIEIRDAGPNGTGYAACPPTCGDGDEAAFMRQGVFVP